MAFKSGIAAEVIGVPDFSIGANLYEAKIYLDTASLFAWTLAAGAACASIPESGASNSAAAVKTAVIDKYLLFI